MLITKKKKKRNRTQFNYALFSHTPEARTSIETRAALTIGLGGAEAPGPSKEGARDWL